VASPETPGGETFSNVVMSCAGRNPIARTDWLMARLDRFGLTERFERIYVSDAIGAAKPSVMPAIIALSPLSAGACVR
jgi:hypothetical protein